MTITLIDGFSKYHQVTTFERLSDAQAAIRELARDDKGMGLKVHVRPFHREVIVGNPGASEGIVSIVVNDGGNVYRASF